MSGAEEGVSRFVPRGGDGVKDEGKQIQQVEATAADESGRERLDF